MQNKIKTCKIKKKTNSKFQMKMNENYKKKSEYNNVYLNKEESFRDKIKKNKRS